MSQDRMPPELLNNFPQREKEQAKPNFDDYDYQPPSQELSQTYYVSPYVVAGFGLLLFTILIVCGGAYFFGQQSKVAEIPLQATLTLGKDAKANISPSQWITLSVPSTLAKDNIIRTGSDRIYVVELPEGATLRADADTSFKFREIKKEDNKTFICVTLYKGTLFASDTLNTKIAISTKYCDIKPLATKYAVIQQESEDLTEQTKIRVCEGSVEAVHSLDSKMKFAINAGQQLELTETTVNKPHQAEKDAWITWNSKWNAVADIKTDRGVKISESVLKQKTKKKKKAISNQNYQVENDANNTVDDADFQRFRDSKASRKSTAPTSNTNTHSQAPAEDNTNYIPEIPNNREADRQPQYIPPKAVPAPPPLPTSPKREQFNPRYGGDNYAQPTRRGDHKPSASPKVHRNMPHENVPPVQVAPPPDVPEPPRVGGNNRRNDSMHEFDPVENNQKEKKKDRDPNMRMDANGFMYPEHDFEGAATSKSGDPLDAITDTSKDVLKAKPPSSKALDASTYR